jgi:hypothetical protein
MNRRTVIVSALALGLVAWFLRDADPGAIWAQVRRARGELVLASFAFGALSFVLRAVRWHSLLVPVGHVRFAPVLRTTIIGFGALGLLPVRVGDVIRPYLLARREGLSVTATLATVVLERVLDLIAVLTLLAIYVWGFAGGGAIPARLLGPIEASAGLGAVVAVVMLVLMWTLASHPERMGAVAAGVARVLPGSWSHRVGRFAHTFSTGFAATRDSRALAMAVLWSFPLWMAIAAQAWAVTIGFGIVMPYAGAFLLQALLVLGVIVPTPGGVGGFHEAYRIGVTTFFGATNERAIAAAIVTHAVAFVPVVIVGLVLMAQDGLSLGGLRGLANAARQQERT